MGVSCNFAFGTIFTHFHAGKAVRLKSTLLLLSPARVHKKGLEKFKMFCIFLLPGKEDIDIKRGGLFGSSEEEMILGWVVVEGPIMEGKSFAHFGLLFESIYKLSTIKFKL